MDSRAADARAARLRSSARALDSRGALSTQTRRAGRMSAPINNRSRPSPHAFVPGLPIATRRRWRLWRNGKRCERAPTARGVGGGKARLRVGARVWVTIEEVTEPFARTGPSSSTFEGSSSGCGGNRGPLGTTLIAQGMTARLRGNEVALTLVPALGSRRIAGLGTRVGPCATGGGHHGDAPAVAVALARVRPRRLNAPMRGTHHRRTR